MLLFVTVTFLFADKRKSSVVLMAAFVTMMESERDSEDAWTVRAFVSIFLLSAVFPSAASPMATVFALNSTSPDGVESPADSFTAIFPLAWIVPSAASREIFAASPVAVREEAAFSEMVPSEPAVIAISPLFAVMLLVVAIS